MRFRVTLWMLMVLWVISACNLTTNPNQVEQSLATPTGAASGKPVVVINSPASGSEVIVGSQILVSANATDSVGVTRVQLFANGSVVKTVSSESPNGDRSLNVLLDYTPRDPGVVNMQVIAYRAAIASDPAQIQINVRASQAQVTATPQPQVNVPVINPNDPTCRALINVGLNLRTGPGTVYPRITVLNAGTVTPIIGRTSINDWWQVRVNTTIGWISAEYTTVYGICNAVPIVAAPPTPTTTAATATNTPIPTNTLTTTPLPATATNTPSPADLVVTNMSGPATLNLGFGNTPVTASFTVTITNTGGSTTGQFSNVVVINPGGTETPLGVVASLESGQSILLTISLTFSSTGPYTLQARADSDSQITEVSEVNNIGIANITINEAPAVMPMFTLDPGLLPTLIFVPGL